MALTVVFASAAMAAQAGDRVRDDAEALKSKAANIERKLERAREGGDTKAVERLERKAEKARNRQNKPKDRDARSTTRNNQQIMSAAGIDAGDRSKPSDQRQHLGWSHQVLQKLSRAYKDGRITADENRQAEQDAYSTWKHERKERIKQIERQHPGSRTRDGTPCVPDDQGLMGCGL